MADPPERYKNVGDYTAEEHLRLARTGERAETAEYIAAKAAALQKAGLADDDAPPPADRNDWSAQQHLNALQRED